MISLEHFVFMKKLKFSTRFYTVVKSQYFEIDYNTYIGYFLIYHDYYRLDYRELTD